MNIFEKADKILAVRDNPEQLSRSYSSEDIVEMADIISIINKMYGISLDHEREVFREVINHQMEHIEKSLENK